VIEWQHVGIGHGTEALGGSRHTEYGAGRLVLGEGATSLPVDLQQTGRTVISHAGEQYAHSRLSGSLGYGQE
jgi:hypothetical protein